MSQVTKNLEEEIVKSPLLHKHLYTQTHHLTYPRCDRGELETGLEFELTV